MVAAKGRLTTRNAHADTPYPIRVLLAGAGAFGKEHLSRLTMLCGTSRIIFWPACAIVRKPRRSVCRKL
jgi:hypothetical protein